MLQDAEMNFCNSCNLAGYLNDCRPELLPLYSDIIQRLITVCGDRIGNLRKNAAIFLAKLAKNPQNLDLIRSLHGIEILHSITAQVVGKSWIPLSSMNLSPGIISLSRAYTRAIVLSYEVLRSKAKFNFTVTIVITHFHTSTQTLILSLSLFHLILVLNLCLSGLWFLNWVIIRVGSVFIFLGEKVEENIVVIL